MGATDSIIHWIRENCRQIPAGKEVRAGTLLLEHNWLDSLQIMHLVSHLEKEHGLAIDVEEMVPENFETPDSVAAMVARLKAAPKGA